MSTLTAYTSFAPFSSFLLEGNWLSLIWQLHDINACTFLVELQLKRPYLTLGGDLSTWEVKSHSWSLSSHLSSKFPRFNCVNTIICMYFRLLLHCHIWTGNFRQPSIDPSLYLTCGNIGMFLACISYLEEYPNDLGIEYALKFGGFQFCIGFSCSIGPVTLPKMTRGKWKAFYQKNLFGLRQLSL